ncbi:MAG: hypothetical protein ACI90V_012507 [Bacillariaceae sp.]|jgi:hypothetical protein
MNQVIYISIVITMMITMMMIYISTRGGIIYPPNNNINKDPAMLQSLVVNQNKSPDHLLETMIRNIDNEVESNEIIDLDWSDKIFGLGGWDNSPIVIESHKILFFTVPKNACSTFKQLFRRMMGYKNWLTGSPHNPETNGLKYLGHYPPDKQKEFMTSSDWTRAIFIRDPLERTLSAYMDKGLKTGPLAWQPSITGAHIKRHCCGIWEKGNPICKLSPFTPHETNLTKDNFPFESFVVSFMRQCQDSHWNQQIHRMKQKNWKWINFVGHFENMQNDTRRLLKKIGAYEEFGATGWGKSSSDTNRTLSIFEKNLANHKTGSRNYMKNHYSTKSERLVLQYYRRDYSFDLFNFTRPVNYTQKLFGRGTTTKKNKPK